MKLFKRAVSCALAAVMSLAMLTACGGGGGGGGSQTTKIDYKDSKLYAMNEAPNNAETFYTNIKLEIVDDSSVELISVQNGENKVTQSTDGSTTCWIFAIDGEYVYIDSTGTIEEITAAQMEQLAQESSLILSEDQISEIEAGYETYNGTNYYCETLKLNQSYKNHEIIFKLYCLGDTPKYLLGIVDGETLIIETINSYMTVIPDETGINDEIMELYYAAIEAINS